MNCRTGRLAACALALAMVSAQAEELKKVMLVSEALGYKHKEALTIGADAIALGGRANKWFATTHAKIADLTNAQAVAAFDAIVLNNTTDLECEKYPGLESVLTNFVASGKGIVFLHAAVDAFYKSPAIQEMSGGLFSGHPWYFEGTWKFRNEAPGSELNRSFGGVETFWASDEIYQQKSPPFDRKTCKVLVSLAADEPDNRKAEDNWRNHKLERIRRDFPIRADRDFAVSWKRAYGKGRVFYTSFGHDKRAFMDPARFGHIMAGIRYAAGDPDITLGATPSAAALTEAREFASSDGGVFRYRWHQPPKFEPGKTYPMLIYMHGAGSRGTNNVGHLYWAASLVFDLEKRFGKDYFFLAGQVPKDKRWVEVDWSSTAHAMPAEPSETMGRQIEFLEKAFRELPIDRSRVYVTGLSMGGYGTWDLICRKPEWFAAAIPVCGGGDVRMAGRLRGLPIWAYHGDLDTTVPTVRSRNMVRAIWEEGGNIKYSELPEVAHCSWIQAYGSEKTLDWLYSQRRAGDAVADPEPPTEVVVAAVNSRSFEKCAADFVCTGTNDEAVINAAIERLRFGGTVRLADGDYRIDACTNEGNSAICFGYNGGLTRVVTVKGTTEGKIYGAYRGATLHVTKCAMDAMAADGTYRVFFGAGRIPEGRGDTYTYTHVNNVNFTNFRILFHDASKPLVGIDGRHFGSMELDLVGIYTERYFPDRYEHLKPATPAKGSVGVYSLPGSNDESARNRYNEVNVGGLHTGFVFDEVDHLVMTGCMAARCVCGYRFERGSPKTLTMINCCDEGNALLPRFRGRGHLTAIDFNIERFNAAYIPDDPEGDVDPCASEEIPGAWKGSITYTLQGAAFGIKGFWKNGHGKGFETRRLD